ncbi:MAG TPA: hypothetical protein VIO14_01015 [Dehalococcoidia bacterium]
MATTWKHAERRIAALLSGRRVPVTGRARGDAPDVSAPGLAVEVKHRAALPAWLLTALAQAEAAAEGDQLPVAVLHGAGGRYADALVVVRLRDFARLLAAWTAWHGGDP